MKQKSIRQTIRRVESQLSWHVVRSSHDDTLDIISDPVGRVHTIRYPNNPHPSDPVRDIEFLHELGHAYLAESEPVFCVHDFISQGLDINEALPLLSDPVRATADWFVDDLVMQWEPAGQLEYIIEHIELVRRSLSLDPSPSPERSFAFAFILAQGKHYKIRFPYPKSLADAINTFLSVNPRVPTRDNFSRLFNNLLLPTNLRATWSDPDHAWVVTRS